MAAVAVRDPMDVFQAQRAAKTLAAELGFNAVGCQELAIVASELASNILKYGETGEIVMRGLTGDNGPYFEFVAFDSGPQFRDLNAALKDGWDQDGPIDPVAFLKRKGIGGGLGAVVRLTDTFTVEPLAQGKQIIARRYLRRLRLDLLP